MSSISDVTTVSVNSELTDDDLDPMFAYVSVLANVAEDFTGWYEQSADNLETAAGWLDWISGAFAGAGPTISDEDRAEVIAFTSWLEQTGFDVEKYFHTSEDSSTGATYATKLRDKYEDEPSEIVELIALEVESVSSNAEQASLFTNAVIDNFSAGNDETVNVINTFRSAGRGHLRT